MAPPSPLFITKMKAPNSPTQKGLTPPRSPSGEKYSNMMGRTISPKQSNSLIDGMQIKPTHNNFTNEAFVNNDPYNSQLSKTDGSVLSKGVKNGSLDFGDFKSGGQESNGFAPSPHTIDTDKMKQTSPRSPVGRTDKRPKELNLIDKQKVQRQTTMQSDNSKFSGREE